MGILIVVAGVVGMIGADLIGRAISRRWPSKNVHDVRAREIQAARAAARA